MLAEEIIRKPIGISPHSLAAIITSAICITGAVVGTWVSTISRIDALGTAQIEIRAAIEAMRISGMDDRYRGKDADRTLSVMRKMNMEKYPDFVIPIPTTVRDGQIEVFK